MRKLAIIGTKEFAQQIRGFAKKCGEYEFVGYLDDLEQKGSVIDGFPVLGKVNEGIRLHKEGIIDCVFIAIGYTRFDLRESYFNELKGEVPFANIIPNTSCLGDNIKLGEGVYIGDRSIIGNNTIIEDNVFIHGNTIIAHDNIIGAHSYISGRFNTAGFTKLGKRNFYGICSLVSDHITICDDVWIGLGCIIVRNINEPGKYMVNHKLIKIE